MISNAIVKHIFNHFGIWAPGHNPTFTILSNKFKIDKNLSIELEDGEHLQKNIWGITGKISTSIIKVLVADITTDADIKEYVLLLQLDELSIYALKIELLDEAVNKAYLNHNDEAWVELSNLLLAKLLVGIEQINELFVNYQPLTNYQELYQYLISFMNYEEATQNLK